MYGESHQALTTRNPLLSIPHQGLQDSLRHSKLLPREEDDHKLVHSQIENAEASDLDVAAVASIEAADFECDLRGITPAPNNRL